MQIPFSPPRIDDKIVAEVSEALRSGWITTGPRTKKFEQKIAEYVDVPRVVCLNSGSAGLELALRWYGVQEGDEVIVPAYTYCATANVVVHCGAKPVMVDVRNDFNIDVNQIKGAITEKTKAIIPVDIAGYPCDYDEINRIVNDPEVKSKFQARTPEQEKLGRILVLSDAAHSIGAEYKHKKTGSLCDLTVFSFHAVKNLTTAEGGAICIALPEPFDVDEIYSKLVIKSLHGQTKDALTKTKPGNWRYDVVEPGHKCNMTDVLASIGLVELERYEQDMLVKRKEIFDTYSAAFSQYDIFEVPEYESGNKKSSYHVYPLKIKGITEEQRDLLIQKIAEQGVGVNVHFIPLPMLTAYKSRGYRIEDFPVSYDLYSREISLPVYYDLTPEMIKIVLQTILSLQGDIENFLNNNL